MEIWIIVLIAIAVIGIILIAYIAIFNKLQFGNTKIEHVEGLIDEDLRTKYDIILRTEDVLKNQLKTKKDYLKEFTKLKNEKNSNFDLERKLKEAEMIITNLFNDNLELNKNENMIQIMEDFKKVNQKLTAGISYYNKQTNILNAYIRKFPNNLIAKIHKVKIKPFFDRKDMTDTDIEDFKL